MQMTHVISSALCACSWRTGGALTGALAVALVLSQPGASRLSAQDKEAQFAQQMKAAEQLATAHKYEQAVDAYKKANSLKGDASLDALMGLTHAYMGLGAFKNAVSTCEQGLKIAGDNPVQIATFRNQRGLVLVAWGSGDKPDLQKLKDAEVDFRAVLAATDKMPVASYNLGIALLKQNRDNEGVHELTSYVERAGRAPEVEKAKAMIENPRRARENYAPEFSITTLEDEFLTLKDLTGKVVLLDFWGTWCGPCVAAAPHLVDYYKKMAKNPDFVMIGIACAEKNEADWRAFIDKSHKVQAAYGIHTFPNYLVIDGDGIVQSENDGWGNDTMTLIETGVNHALKSLKAKAPLFERPIAAPR
jgi:thiol-disulfide isomerase/thioredoxin